MNDILLESIRVIVLMALLGYLWRAGKRRTQLKQEGWWLISDGCSLLLLGSAVDITDNFNSLNRFVVIGDAETQAFLEKMIGYLGGLVVLTIGLIRWIPTVASVKETETLAADLSAYASDLIRVKETAEGRGKGIVCWSRT